MMILYSAALTLALVVGLPYWLLRMAASGKYRAGLAQRLGRVPPLLRQHVQGKPVVWLHAVSVGEVLAIERLVRELAEALPDHAVVVSTTTLAGQRLARQRFGQERVFYFPLDLRFIVQRYLRALRPQLLVLAETEFWPNLLVACRRHSVPVAVVNARISDRSLPRYRRLRFLWSKLLASVSIFLAQSDEDAHRLQQIGVAPARIHVAGNLKFDVRPPQETALAAALLRHLPHGAKLLVCGSTLEGEENALLECWPAVMAACPQAAMVLAPRHPERFDAVAKLLAAHRTQWLRRSLWLADQGLANAPRNAEQRPTPASIPPGTILLLDSIGELASIYNLAAVAFVGGSLFGAGGHNPLEPAQFSVPVVMGESHENFRGIVSAMIDGHAICVVRPAQLCSVLAGMLSSGGEAEARAMGERGRDVFASQAGATGRAVNALLAILRGNEPCDRRRRA